VASFETAVGELDNLTISAQDRALRSVFIIVSDFVCLSAALGVSLRKRDVHNVTILTRRRILCPAFLLRLKEKAGRVARAEGPTATM